MTGVQTCALPISNSKNHQYRLTNFLNKGWVREEDMSDSKYENLKVLTSDHIKESYQKLKEEMAAKVLGTYCLPPMQQQAQGFVAQTIDEILQTK